MVESAPARQAAAKAKKMKDADGAHMEHRNRRAAAAEQHLKRAAVENDRSCRTKVAAAALAVRTMSAAAVVGNDYHSP